MALNFQLINILIVCKLFELYEPLIPKDMQLFDEMPKGDILSWNLIDCKLYIMLWKMMISGNAQNDRTAF